MLEIFKLGFLDIDNGKWNLRILKYFFDYVFLNVYGLYILVLFINNEYYYLYYIIVMRLYRDS